MSTWLPILDGALAESARATLQDIAASIGRHCQRPEELVLFWAYGSELDDAATKSARAVDQLLGTLDRGANMLHLYGGLAGAGWTLAHVGDPDDCEEILSAIDTTLLRVLTGPGWGEDYDLIRGIAGIAVYFLERLDGQRDLPVPNEALAHIVNHFRSTAIVDPSGITWHTDPLHLPMWQRTIAPDGYFNCGVAHGVPGAMSVLARIAAIANPSSATARELVTGAMRWLESQQLPDGGFTSWIAPGLERSAARSAWCYGDPGVATASWSAAARVGAPIDMWRALALECTRRPAVGVFDGSLCHGAFGLVHLFNRCFQASGESVFRDAALGWIERGLAMRRPGEGVAGYAQYSLIDGVGSWTTTDSLLDGAAGIGLVLLAALCDTEPRWDRLLACDIPMR
jgi:hypothetical protein